MGRNAISLILVSALVGCGAVKDSGFTDAGTDAEVADAGPDADLSGTATVVTQSALFGDTPGAAAGEIDIVSMLPDNTVLEVGKTDAAGNATIKVYPGGTVTAIYKHTADIGVDLITWAGVKPGDTLTFGNVAPQFVGTNTNLGSQTYTWPALAGVNVYRVFSGCTSAAATPPATSAAASEFTSCHSDPMDVVFTATSPTGPSGSTVLTHCSNRPNATFSTGTPISIGSWGNAVNATANVTGLPAEVTTLNARFSTILDGNKERSLSGGGSANGAASGGAFTGNFPWCTVGERTFASLFLSRSNPMFGGIFQQARVLDSLPSNATSWTVAAPQLPPWIEGTFLTSAALRLVQWVMVPGENSSHDAVALQVSWTLENAGTFFTNRWHVVMPPDTQATVMPALPAPFDALLPSTDFGLGLQQLRSIELPTVTNYDAVRAMPSSALMCPECVVRAGEIQRVVLSGF